MEANSICEICNKGFANRKALGGHMRSHLAKLPLPSKQSIQQYSSSSSSSDSESGVVPDVKTFDTTLNHYEEPDETKSSDLISSSLRRTKRRCRRESEKAAASSESPEQVSSSSTLDFNVDFEAATALMMISEGLTNERKRKIDDYIDENDEYEDEEDESYNSVPNRVESKIPKSGYRCDLCNKVFRSHQALGGHKANHKRISEQAQFNKEEGSGSSNKNQRKFNCSFCGREFHSGQALGGHKKMHLAHLGTTYNVHQAAQTERELLDLNIPAPELLEACANRGFV